MSETLRPKTATARSPLGDATHRINNNLSQAVVKPVKSQDHDAASIRSIPFCPRGADNPAHPHSLPDPDPRDHRETANAAPPRQADPVQPRHPRARAVQEADPAKRVSQASQTSTAPSSNRSSGYGYKTQIGPWQLGRTLGKGSSARVRLCRHRLSGELAAVKIIPKKSAYLIQHGSLAALHKYDDNLPERIEGEMRVPLSIEREVAILKLVDHPNVMKVYDIWENRSEIYLVLEYVDKGDLFDFINSSGRLSEESAMYFFRQVMSAMQYCHTFNICHRDLKPENILLNGNNHVKIADFGMAALHQTESHHLQTACGSPHYAAPELLKNRAYRGDRADVWSMGVILYAMLAASLPFDDPDVRLLLAKTKKGQYEMPECLSLEAKDLIRRMLQVNPEIRISLEEIWRHPLVLKYDYLDDLGGKGGQPLNIREGFHYSPVAAHQVDAHLVRQLRSLWHSFEDQQIEQMLMDSSKNDLKLFYWLLQNYRQKQLENFLPELAQSPSDYHHLHEPRWKKRVSTCEFNRPNSRGPGRSISKFTVISHVADNDAATVNSYDPYKADRPMRRNSQASHAKIIVHRKGQASRGSAHDETYTTQLSRTDTRSTYRHDRMNSQRTVSTSRLTSISSARNSLSSLPSSRKGAAYSRPASRRRRGIDFSQARKQSVERHHGKGGSRNRPASTAGDGIAYQKPSRARADPTSPSRSRPIMDRPKPRLRIKKQEDPCVLVEEEVRNFSDRIAKDCDEAFTSSMIESDISGLPASDEKSSERRYSTPFSFSTKNPNMVTPTIQSNGHPWDERPLPPLPSESPGSPVSVAPKTEEVARNSQHEQANRKGKIFGRLSKPVLLPKSERRVVSAPAHSSQGGKGHDGLPSISENVRDESDRARIVSAPPPKTPREQDDAAALDYLSRVGDTIRVVNSPTATSPVPKPLNVRKKHPEQPTKTSVTDLRQAYMHGAINDTTARPVTASSQRTDTVQKKKSSWFRWSSKEDAPRGHSDHTEDAERSDTSSQLTRPHTMATQSSDTYGPGSTSSHDASIPPPMPAKKKAFGFLFWKSNKSHKKDDSRMSIAGPEYEDTLSPDSSRPSQRRGHVHSHGLPESDSDVRKIEVRQNWLARLFGVKPATEYMCLAVSRRAARQEIAILFREWRRYGIRDVQVDKERDIVFARVGAHNYLNIKEVALAAEIMTVIEHGKGNSLSIVRFTQERGAVSSFHRVVGTLKAVLESRNMIVTDKRKAKMMTKTLNS